MLIFVDELLLGQKLPETTSLLLKKFLQNNETSFTEKEVVLGKRKKLVPHRIPSKPCVFMIFIQPKPLQNKWELDT